MDPAGVLMLKRVQLFFEKLNISISNVKLTLKSFDYTKPQNDPNSLYHAVENDKLCPVITSDLNPNDPYNPEYHAMTVDNFDSINRVYVCKNTYPDNGGKIEIPEYQGFPLNQNQVTIRKLIISHFLFKNRKF